MGFFSPRTQPPKKTLHRPAWKTRATNAEKEIQRLRFNHADILTSALTAQCRLVEAYEEIARLTKENAQLSLPHIPIYPAATEQPTISAQEEQVRCEKGETFRKENDSDNALVTNQEHDDQREKPTTCAINDSL